MRREPIRITKEEGLWVARRGELVGTAETKGRAAVRLLNKEQAVKILDGTEFEYDIIPE